MTTKNNAVNKAALKATLQVRSKLMANLSKNFKASDNTRNKQQYDLRQYCDNDTGICYYPYMFSKTLKHTDNTDNGKVWGLPTVDDVDLVVKAVDTGTEEDVNNIELSNVLDGRKLENCTAQHSYSLIGPDCSIPISNAECLNKVDTPELLWEMAEIYAMSKMREVKFTELKTGVNGNAMVDTIITNLNTIRATLSNSTTLVPISENQITRQTLFRGIGTDEEFGPYVSQFLVTSYNYGNLYTEQKYNYTESDITTTSGNWLNVQDGNPQSPLDNAVNPGWAFNGRVVGAKVHNDPLYQFYYQAAQIAGQNNINPDFGTVNSKNTAWTSGGGPSILATLAHVAEGALLTAWHQKWSVSMRIRPEVLAQRIHMAMTLSEDELAKVPGLSAIRNIIQSDSWMGMRTLLSEKYFLTGMYSEGSPTHPSYPAGHATVAGACTTILKAMYKTHTVTGDQAAEIKWHLEGRRVYEPTDANEQGVGEIAPSDSNSDNMTVNGEFNKLASNISIGRNWAGVHYRSDGDCGLSLGEDFAIKYLIDKAATYNESYTTEYKQWDLRKFNGDYVTISKDGCVKLDV